MATSSRSLPPDNESLKEILLQESAYFTEPMITVPSTDKLVFYLEAAEDESKPGELKFNFCQVWQEPKKEEEKKSEEKKADEQETIGINFKNYIHKHIIPLKLIKTADGHKLVGSPDPNFDTLPKFLRHYTKDHYAFILKKDSWVAASSFFSYDRELEKETDNYLHCPVSEISITKNYLSHTVNKKYKIKKSLELIEQAMHALYSGAKSSEIVPEEKNTSIYDYFEWHKENKPAGIVLPDEFKDVKRIRFLCYETLKTTEKKIQPKESELENELESALTRMKSLREEERTAEKIRIDVTYTSGEKKSGVVMLNPLLGLSVESLRTSIKNIGARRWDMLVRMHAYPLNWFYLDKYYAGSQSDDPTQLYKIFHKIMQDDLIIKVIKIAQEFKKTGKTGTLLINLIDAGCGKAPQLLKGACLAVREMMKTNFPDINFRMTGLGFDNIPGNIKHCNEDKLPVSDVRFIEGDFNNIEDIIHRETPSGENQHNIVFSSGTLTRLSLNNAFEATHILQSTWRGNVNSIIASGITEFLFTERILKRIGFSINKVNLARIDYGNHPILTLERISTETQVARLMKKLKSKQILDLSLSPDPLGMLMLINKKNPSLLSQMKSIDLSFTNIEDYEKLNKLLGSCPALKKINFFSHDLTALKHFSRNILRDSSIQLMTQYVTGDETFLFASQTFYKRFNYISPVNTEAARLFSRYAIDYLPDTEETEIIYEFLLQKIKEKPELFTPESSITSFFKSIFSNPKEFSPRSIVTTLLELCEKSTPLFTSLSKLLHTMTHPVKSLTEDKKESKELDSSLSERKIPK